MNKFLDGDDYGLVSFSCIRQEMTHIYSGLLGQVAHTSHQKEWYKTGIFWSRDWEYPWAVINSNVKKGQRVLDVGCGGSPLLPFLALKGCVAYGVDVYDIFSGNIGNLKSFTEHPNDALGTDISYSQQSMDELGFDDGFFDVVYCISVIEHVGRDTALRGMLEMKRVLKPRGLLVVTMDDWGATVPKERQGFYVELMEGSGMTLYGESNFDLPNPSKSPGNLRVVGFVLQKD